MAILSSILSFLGGLKLSFKTIVVLIILAIFAAIILGGLYYKHEYHSEQAKVTALLNNEKILVTNQNNIEKSYNLCVADNNQNEKTIGDLIAEKAADQKALDILSQQNKINVANLNALQTKINEMKSIPGDNGSVAPVLKDTIISIQEQETQGDNK